MSGGGAALAGDGEMDGGGAVVLGAGGCVVDGLGGCGLMRCPGV